MSFITCLHRPWLRRVVLLFCLALGSGLFATAHAMVPPTERAVLDAIWFGTGGQLPGSTDSTWTNRGGWGIPVFLGISECGSYGITCVLDQQGKEHISGIDLHQNGLTGELPSSLSGLPYLQGFWVWGNDIGGRIPSVTGLNQLEVFYVAYNHLTGSIPSLAGLSALWVFDASWNNLTGTIPPLAGSPHLQAFRATSNQLSGSIPSLANLTELIEFNASSNQLTGPIPSLTGLLNLRYFEVSANGLGGNIPSLAGLTNLRYFMIDSNQLNGPIPSLSGLNSLDTFYVGGNRLTGTLPPAPASLQWASLCSNFFSLVPQPTIDPAWEAATQSMPWWATPDASNRCDDLLNNGFEVIVSPEETEG